MPEIYSFFMFGYDPDNQNGGLSNFLKGKLAFLLATPTLFLGGLAVQQYQIPNSFVRVNADKAVVFFMNTYAGQLVLNPQKYASCITQADPNAEPYDVVMCLVK